MIKIRFNFLYITVLSTLISWCPALAEETPSPASKYVFLFIGDGMAAAQVHATEAYLSATQPESEPGKEAILTMDTFPIHAMQISHSNNSLITDSAAAGTALACGQKTNNGVLAKSPDLKHNYRSIAELAKSKGMKVGIVTSVSLDHATPASFYAHQNSRENYEQIAFELLEKDFDYFGGGGFKVDTWRSRKYRKLSLSQRYEVIKEAATANGFTYVNNREDFAKANSGRVLAVNRYLDGLNSLPYNINIENAGGEGGKYDGSISLAEFTQKGIDLLENENGFFMMVEGGKIDWACHANDARAAIDETIAFDEAISVALKFYQAHPEETTIVVTGDHECGGMALGFAATKYTSFFHILSKQKLAFDEFNSCIIPAYKESHDTFTENIDQEMWQIIFDCFGLDGADISPEKSDNLSEYQKIMLENAYDKQFNKTSDMPKEQEYILYGKLQPMTISLTHIINQRAGLSWTSYAHTAIPVPVRAIGKDQDNFSGYYQNVEIPRRLATIINGSLTE